MAKRNRKPIVAVVGRPNVGKSTLFNALAGERISIVQDTPGITRDRIYTDVTWLDRTFTLIDTGGIEPDSKDIILSQMRAQAQIAIDTADVIIFLVDVKQGLVDADDKVADMLRRSHKPVVLVVNKVDSVNKYSADVFEFYNLGIGEPHPVSAVNKLGLGDMLEEVVSHFDTEGAGEEEDERLDEPSEDKSGERTMDTAQGTVTFRNVDFSYYKGRQVLYGFDLEVRAGQKVALVGATGSGKTTVVNLLMRFYDIDSGEILIDGVNIRDIASGALRRSTAIVLQDTVLFSGTIRENLTYSNPDASEEDLDHAARMSACAGLIARLPQGYDTPLTEGGGNLSQGERQLLSICRAFLASPKILILDEATSSVDTRTEKNIQDAMVNLMKNRTSLIIAHRLSTIQDADLIVVMDQGRIVETGKHDELLAREGRYYDLYMTQFAGNQI